MSKRRITPQQRKAIYAIKNRLGIDDEELKAAIWSFSAETTSSLSAEDGILEWQAKELIHWLNDRQIKRADNERLAGEQMRRKIFALLYDARWVLPPDKLSMPDRNRATREVKELVKKLGYLKPKPLNGYTIEELPKLVNQFESITKNTPK
jgi:hypothetical protein